MSFKFKPYTEKMKKKKIGIFSILGRIWIRIRIQNRTRIRIHHPGSGSADPDPDPHQNETDPKHWIKESIFYFYNTVGNVFGRREHSTDETVAVLSYLIFYSFCIPRVAAWKPKLFLVLLKLHLIKTIFVKYICKILLLALHKLVTRISNLLFLLHFIFKLWVDTIYLS